MHVCHQLLPRDFARRTQFARWFIDRCERDEIFLRTIVIGDEATFQMNGKVNTQNVREYAPIGQAPEFNFNVNMSRQKLAGWLGLCGNGQVIGPFFFERNVNGVRYLQMLNDNVVPQLLALFDRQHGGVFRRLW